MSGRRCSWCPFRWCGRHFSVQPDLKQAAHSFSAGIDLSCEPILVDPLQEILTHRNGDPLQRIGLVHLS